MLKAIIAIIFLVSISVLIWVSYNMSHQTNQEFVTVATADSQDDLTELDPMQIFRLTIKNTMPEIKLLSVLLFVIFVVVIFSAKREMVSDVTRMILEKSFASMMERRSDKLAEFERQKDILRNLGVDGRNSPRTTFEELERRYKRRL
jgi:TRAP-type C4-dicarboxylate transport system permease small subunit